MLDKLKSRGFIIFGLASISMVALFLGATGCGSDKTADDKGIVVRNPQRTYPAPTVATSPATSTPLVQVASTPEPVVTKTPEPPKEVTYEEAESVFRERRYSEAMELFTLYTERKSENPWGFYMLGLSAWQAGEHTRAEASFGRALELDPKHVKSYINLSRVLLEKDQPNDALTQIESALAIDPESNAAYRLKGRALHEVGMDEHAVAAYRQAIRIDNDDAWSMNNLGLMLIRKGRFEEALKPLARAVELKDDVAVFHNNLGLALERNGQYRMAETQYQLAVTIDTSYEKAGANHDRISSVLEERGLEPLDLAVVAQSFVDDIASWSDAVVVSEPIESVEPDVSTDVATGDEPTEDGEQE